MAMVLLSPSNKILEDLVSGRVNGTVEDVSQPLEVRLCDFDNTSYHVVISPEKPGILEVSMTCSCFPQLKALGIDGNLKAMYGPLLADQPNGNNDVTLRVNLNEEIADKAGVIKKLSMMKADILGAPIDNYLTQLQQGKASEPSKLAIRDDSVIYFFPKADRCTLVYALDFHQKSDLVIAKVFLNAFVEARRTVNTAPICAFDVKPPMEMRHFGIEEPQGTTGFLSITLLKEHVASAEKKAVAVGLLHMLRNYLQYHIKCSKAFFHQRMRARVVALLQVMNRSRMEEVQAKAKKTASGRTFVRD